METKVYPSPHQKDSGCELGVYIPRPEFSTHNPGSYIGLSIKGSMTDWYIGHENGQECFDSLPSPDTWWGGSPGSGWPNTFDSGYLLSKNRAFGGSATACARPDSYFNDLTMDHYSTDDIYLSSLLQDDILPFQSLYIAVPSDSNSTIVDFQSTSGDADNHASDFSSRNQSYQSSCPSVKVAETRDMVPSHQHNLRGSAEVDDFSSHEESVLMKLESVLNQMNDKTRLCLRDSLYRLAKHSEQQTSTNDLVDGVPIYESSLPETSGVCSRSMVADTTESETNAIDRAVAYLMFSKVDANEQDHLPPLSPEFMHNHGNLAARTSDLSVQCEVPVFSQQTQRSSRQLGIGSQNNAF